MKVFFRTELNARNAKSYSPSADKPRLAVEAFLSGELIDPDDVLSFEPANREQMKLAHDGGYAEAMLDLREFNDFGNAKAEVAASLPYTSGALLAAAQYEWAHSEAVFSATSGFHHGRRRFGTGFYTFNRLMVTTLALKQQGLVNAVGIIDLDAHYGDGTDDIMGYCGVNWIHHTQGAKFHKRQDVGPGARHYLDWLDGAIADCQGVDLFIYQAGADPHINDPLGGMLTEVEVSKRHYSVFKGFKGPAIVWNLEGGYQISKDGGIAPVLKLHRNTVVICQTVNATQGVSPCI